MAGGGRGLAEGDRTLITWNDGQVLRAMMGLQVTEEQLQSIATRAIQEADLDRDGAVSFDEFRKVGTRTSDRHGPEKNNHKRLFLFSVDGENQPGSQDERPVPEVNM